ncbi:MAG TPA: AMMECR1 domain-containing protein, partial [Bacilli bacterium]
TVEKQLQIACEKAGIFPKSAYEIYKFTVERHGGK